MTATVEAVVEAACNEVWMSSNRWAGARDKADAAPKSEKLQRELSQAYGEFWGTFLALMAVLAASGKIGTETLLGRTSPDVVAAKRVVKEWARENGKELPGLE